MLYGIYMTTRMFMVTIFAIALVIFGVVHYVVYLGFVSGFSIENTGVLLLLRAVFTLLTLSFIVATSVSHFLNNSFSRKLYTISAIWIGLLVYLFLGSVLYFIILFFTIPPPWLIVSVYVVSILAVTYGVVHAKTIKVKRVSITLPNLPDSWKDKKMLFVSDLHLGQIYGRGFTQKIADLIHQIHPDIVCIGGDVFDGVKVDPIEVVEPFSHLKVPKGVFFITGNHEEYFEHASYLDSLRNVGVRILMNEVVFLDGIQLIGVDYTLTDSEIKFESILKSITIDPAYPTILLKHVPNHLELAEAKGIHLQLSGHTHKAQMFPFNLLTKRIFKGFDYGLKLFGKMHVYTSSGVGTWGPPIRIWSDSEVVIITFQ